MGFRTFEPAELLQLQDLLEKLAHCDANSLRAMNRQYSVNLITVERAAIMKRIPFILGETPEFPA